jgi:hypothetical protein
VSREGWSALLFAFRAKGRVMAIPESFPRQLPHLAVTPSAYDGGVQPPQPLWRWRQGALYLCVGAQLITISALLGSVPVPATWASLLLAVAPIPLAALTAFTPVRLARMLAPLTALVLVVGIAGSITHAGWVFVPALVLLVVVTLRLPNLPRHIRPPALSAYFWLDALTGRIRVPGCTQILPVIRSCDSCDV